MIKPTSPFDLASDEDLLASINERSSKALQMMLLGEQDGGPSRKKTENYVKQLLVEIQTLHRTLVSPKR